MNPKKITSILAIIIIATSFMASLVVNVSASHDPDWYTLVNGVLTTDTYDFYPYDNLSVDFGYSKFGELLYWDDDHLYGVGLQYPGYDSVGTYIQPGPPASRDPFGNELVDEDLWLNGWFAEIRYTHRSHRDRKVMAMAMFADMTASGGEWITGFDPTKPFTQAPFGGRKTTGYAETEDAKVLYDGPRKYIAETLTHLYDWVDGDDDGMVDHPDETWALVDVKLTFIFNKVKKQVIILKDIKQVIDGKELDSPIDIQFSNREEWDLGPAPDYESYAHWYHQNFTTCYGPEWHLAPGIMREVVYEHTATQTVTPYSLTLIIPNPPGMYDFPTVDGSIRVYLNGMYLEEGEARDWELVTDGGRGGPPARIIIHPRGDQVETDDLIKVIYKVWKYHGESVVSDSDNPDGTDSDGIPHLFDVVQVISSDAEYVGWKAFWPVCSDYTPDGWAMWWEPLIWVNENDMSTEPDIPFTIGEWDFMLGKGYPAMFRGVEVVGLTNLHDGDDDDLGTVNMIDTEAWYQLQEIFNPWDLQKAVHKPTKTWVEWAIGTSWTSTHGPVVDTTDAEYDDYCVFSERVWDETEGELEVRRSWAPNDYNWYVDPATGKATITGLDSGHMYKIVYHTEPVVVGAFVKSLEAGMNVTPAEFEIEIPVFDTIADSWTDNLGVDHTLSVDQDIPFNITILDQTGTWTDSWTWSWTWDETDLKVYRENTMKSVIDDVMEPINATSMNDDFLVKDWDLDTVQKWCTASHDLAVTWPMEGETLHVNYLNHTIDVILTVEYNETGNWILWNYNVTVTAEYDEMLGGRWEHTVVGKDAHSVDSMGAALVTAAFKNKQIEIGIADMDMMADSEDLWVPQVMRYFGLTGLNDWDDYLDDLDKSISDPGKRASFKDDWCQTWQISYANIITIGGPLINLASYYFNDFTEAFYGIPEFTPSVWSGAVAASTCWNKNYYYSGPDKGYAVIGTYKDINGTIGLSIWGVWGRDTYYASRFFHEELIYEFQGFDPCITSVIIEIDYTDPDHPCFDIVETLGTISEHIEWTETWDARAWLNSYYWWAYPTGPEGCCTIEKGGIHDP